MKAISMEQVKIGDWFLMKSGKENDIFDGTECLIYRNEIHNCIMTEVIGVGTEIKIEPYFNKRVEFPLNDNHNLWECFLLDLNEVEFYKQKAIINKL